MSIDVNPATETWLRDRVAQGLDTSISDAIERLVQEHQLAELHVVQDDHLWAKPAIDAAIASLARGAGSPLDEVQARLRARRVRTSSA